MRKTTFKLTVDTKRRFDSRIKKEGRSKRRTIERLVRAWIELHGGEQ